MKHAIPCCLLALFLTHGVDTLTHGVDTLLHVSAAETDSRRGEPLTLHGYHPFHPVLSVEHWASRRDAIRTRVLVASGLLPLPERTPLNPVRAAPVEGEGFSVVPLAFESFPGHFVTGSLFLPRGESEQHGVRDGLRAGVLCPHGHWEDGRFYDLLARRGATGVRQEIAIGAERFESAARNPIVARCVQLARMGCVVLLYDMIGYADSVQLTEHRHGPRESMRSPKPGAWGFVSPQATLRLQTDFGLQTWNSVRALDFLASLEEVDPQRLLVTGASGGATQTMILSAIDDRITASFPCVMASTAMQGGCTCENTHYLRIDQGNIDIAAALAPKPLGLTAADDWTVELETKGHPDLKQLYEMLGKPGNYEAHFNVWFKHNYNHVSRTQLYDFANRHLQLGFDTPVLERDFGFLQREPLSVWSSGVKPTGYQTGDDHERALNRRWAEDSDRQLTAALTSAKQGDTSGVDELIRPGWETILRRRLADAGEVSFELAEKTEQDSVKILQGKIQNRTFDESVPARVAFSDNWNGEAVIRLSADGIDDRARPSGDEAVITLELFGQGDSGGSNDPTTYSGREDLSADSWQRSPVYYYGYNDSVFVRQVHDLLSAIRMARTDPDRKVTSLRIEAAGPLAAVALAARAMAGASVDELRVEPLGFRFAQVDGLWDASMVPGAVKYGDLLGLAALGAPHAIAWSGDAEMARDIEELYRGADAAEHFQRF